jgi:hypothetical protein
VQGANSYAVAQKVLVRNIPINVNKETIRIVAIIVREVVFKNDETEAVKAYSYFNSRKLLFLKPKNPQVIS